MMPLGEPGGGEPLPTRPGSQRQSSLERPNLEVVHKYIHMWLAVDACLLHAFGLGTGGGKCGNWYMGAWLVLAAACTRGMVRELTLLERLDAGSRGGNL
eukprot:117111-Chlamydomonas_euryale.AAC.1